MANDTAILSTASSFLDDIVTHNASNTDFRADLTTSIWKWVWPLLCVTGLVGNTLVLLVLRRDGLARTSANVFLTALAVGDTMGLLVASVVSYPHFAWGIWLENTSNWACRAIRPAHATLVTASSWVVVGFTVERCVATRHMLFKLHMHTPRNAGLCCLSLLVLSFVKNIDLCVIFTFTTNPSGDLICTIPLRYTDYMRYYRPWTNVILNTAVPLCIVLVCNTAIIRQLRQNPMPTAVRDSVMRSTCTCLGMSFAFIVCYFPIDMFVLIERYLPTTVPTWFVVFRCLILLRYTNHAINFFLYILTSAHFRSELIALFRSCIQRSRAAATVVRRMSSRVTGRFEFRRGFGDDLEMR
ncbi:hypothetical protein LSAT2_019391 [Lamellibrachia satsuma]|nr:hypothetical protein LSAT2_019391 [Lamellibrachia satsuma]